MNTDRPGRPRRVHPAEAKNRFVRLEGAGVSGPGLLEGKVGLVTGGGSGIGQAVAELMAAEGVTGVVIGDIDSDAAESTAEKIRASGAQAASVQTDVTDPDQVRSLVAEAIKRWGRVDAAVNNAGISGPMLRLGDYTLEDWRKVISINLEGVFNSMQAELAVMTSQGSGSIVNIASGAAIHPRAGLAPYSASKAGVIGLTKAAAGDYAAEGIRVNVVLPGPTRTPLWESNLGPDPEETLRRAEQAAPMLRIGAPRELAEAVVWLSSNRASYMHGAEVLVDGGSHSFSTGPRTST